MLANASMRSSFINKKELMNKSSTLLIVQSGN